MHMKICKAFGTLIIPKWKSSLFWPMVWNAKSNNFHNFVLKFIEYKKPKRFFTVGSDTKSIFAAERLNSNVLVLKVDFRGVEIE